MESSSKMTYFKAFALAVVLFSLMLAITASGSAIGETGTIG